MMKTSVAILMAITLISCTTLHETVFQNIHVGDSKNHLIEVLGNPNKFGPSQRIEGATAFYYAKRRDICGFTIKDDIVKYISCGENPNYINPAAAILQGAGQGLQNSSRSPTNVNCSTTGTSTGGYYSGQTTCY